MKIILLAIFLIISTISFSQFEWDHLDGPPGSGVSLIFSNDKYAFIPAQDFLFRSPDGIHWEKIEHPVSSYMAVYKDTIVNLFLDEVLDTLKFQISTDNGENWVVKDVPTNVKRSIDIAFYQNVIYWTAWDKNLFYSSMDLGDTWEVDTLPSLSGNHLKIFDAQIYLFDYGHLFRSDLSTISWEDITPPLSSSEYIGDIVAVDSHIIVSCDYTIYYSHDDGLTWDQQSIALIYSGDRLTLVGNYVYGNIPGGLIRSDDFGSHWDTLSTDILPLNVRSLGSFRDLLLVGTVNKGIYRWDTTENKFVESNEGLSKGVIYDLATGVNKIWAACGNDIFAFDVPTQAWIRMNLPLPKHRYHFISSNAMGWIVTAEAQSKSFYLSENNGLSWDTINVIENLVPVISGMQLIDEIIFLFSEGQVFRSEDKGQHWLNVATGIWKNEIVSFNERLYLVINFDLYSSSDLGITWQLIQLPFKFYELYSFTDLLYAEVIGAGVELYQSVDGNNWTFAGEGLLYGYYGFELLSYQRSFFFRDESHHYAMLGWQGHFISTGEPLSWSPLLTTTTGVSYVIHDNVLYLGGRGMYASKIENPLITKTKHDALNESPLIRLFPNPVNNSLNIEFKSANVTEGTIIIISPDGKKWKSVHFDSSPTIIEVSVENIPDGVYYLEVITGNENSTYSFVKN